MGCGLVRRPVRVPWQVTDSGSRVRAWPVWLGLTLLAGAAVIALTTTVHGDNYCGRLYFDTQRHSACKDTMTTRSVWFLVVAGPGLLMLAWTLVATRRRRVVVAGLLAATAVVGVLVGFNRLLQPTPPSLFCGSVLNQHGPYGGVRAARCRAIHSSMTRAATAAFAVSALAGVGVGAALSPADPLTPRPGRQRGHHPDLDHEV